MSADLCFSYRRSLLEACIIAFLALRACFAPESAAAVATTSEYCNPLTVAAYTPFILRDEDRYLMYDIAVDRSSIEVFLSYDLMHWSYLSTAYRPGPGAWGKSALNAPCVIRKDAKYYLFCSAMEATGSRRNIIVAQADAATGPFTETKGPLLPDLRSVNTPDLFRDPGTGKCYLYVSQEDYTGAKILGGEIGDSFTEAPAQMSVCLAPKYNWEQSWIEAPYVLRRGKYYYMVYSSGRNRQPVRNGGYADASNPLGPWATNAKELLKKPDVHDGIGQLTLAASPDGRELFGLYEWQYADKARTCLLAMDRLVFTPKTGGADELSMPGAPSTVPQPFPSATTPHPRAATDNFQSGVLDRSHWMIFNELRRNWKLTPGNLLITTDDGDMWTYRADLRNGFFQYAPEGDFYISTRVKLRPRQNHDQAGLIVMHDPDNFVKLSIVYSNGQKIEMGLETGGKYIPAMIDNPIGSDPYLAIEKQGKQYRFYWSSDGTKWNRFEQVHDLEADPIRVGLIGMSPANSTPKEVRFEFFAVGAVGSLAVGTEADTP